jgi:hypothetical protein
VRRSVCVDKSRARNGSSLRGNGRGRLRSRASLHRYGDGHGHLRATPTSDGSTARRIYPGARSLKQADSCVYDVLTTPSESCRTRPGRGSSRGRLDSRRHVLEQVAAIPLAPASKIRFSHLPLHVRCSQSAVADRLGNRNASAPARTQIARVARRIWLKQGIEPAFP